MAHYYAVSSHVKMANCSHERTRSQHRYPNRPWYLSDDLSKQARKCARKTFPYTITLRPQTWTGCVHGLVLLMLKSDPFCLCESAEIKIHKMQTSAFWFWSAFVHRSLSSCMLLTHHNFTERLSEFLCCPAVGLNHSGHSSRVFFLFNRIPTVTI